ncbi:hypothetical protein KS483_004651, partial [Salmonella enterica]|nr:hypothetical protein [Salmonella enterica]
LNGRSGWGIASNLSGLNVMSAGDVILTGTSPGGGWSAGIQLSASNITSQNGSVSLTGSSASDPANTTPAYGLNITDSMITAAAASGNINLTGSSLAKVGLQIINSTLNAARMAVLGNATRQGNGFVFRNTTLRGGLADLTNVTFSSQGSAAGVSNMLDGTLVTDSNRDTLLGMHIENLTSVDMNGTAVFDDSGKTGKGWIRDFTSDDMPYGGWIFNNTTVTAGGTVDLKGVGFTNSVLNVTQGDLDINNVGGVNLSGSSVTLGNGAVSLTAGQGEVSLNNTNLSVPQGGVTVHAVTGGVDLTRGNISAKNDISLKADKGGITITGENATSRAEISSAAGNISINTKDSPNGIGLSVNNVTFTADNNFSIDAVADRAGARISGANITATKGHINLTGSARKGGFDAINDEFAGVILYGDLLFKAGTGTTINATHLSHTASYSPPVPLVLEKANITFDGGANIDACGSYAGIVLASPSFGDAVKSQVFVKNGDLNINATLDGQATTGPTGDAGASASGAIVFQNEYNVLSFELNVDKGSNVTINADSSANKSGPFAAFAAATPESTAASTFHNGFVFSGEGNISVNATSDSADAVNLRLFNNENLSGNLTITGVSDSGIGVNFDKYLSTAVHNATISGKSESGTGVKMTALNGSADLNGNSVSGSTVTGDGGIVLSGSNVTITNGTMVGKATAGNGTGVSMTGGSSYTLDGASVAGTAVDGA